ncbi:hypothetical protein HN803_02120 [candidate division WWE3 bacterium]|jgi:hypothetical protein|nr:hypothetical protein [candidate division WWE3 bacterium]
MFEFIASVFAKLRCFKSEDGEHDFHVTNMTKVDPKSPIQRGRALLTLHVCKNCHVIRFSKKT